MEIGLLTRWKIIFIFLLTAYQGFSAPDPAEEMQAKEKYLIEVLDEISEEHNVYFTYDSDMIKDVKVEYERKEGESIRSVLDRVLKEVNFGFKIFEDRFVIIYKNDDAGIESLEQMIRHMEGIVSARKSAARKDVKVDRLFTPTAQEVYNKRLVINVSGTIQDESGEPLIGVNVIVKGTNKGTATGFNGGFSLEDVDENAILMVSYIGYQTKEIPLNGKNEITITLLEDSQTLDEVVVVGYGTQKKSDVTGAVSQIKGDVAAERSSVQLSQALQGAIPGLRVTRSGSEPNQSATLRIRGITTIGSSEPLVIVDGVPGELDRVNANDVESISVLKDAASASIYGSRAAAGVIVITTKRAAKGELNLNYSYQYGIENATRVPQEVDAESYMRIYNERFWNDNGNTPEFEYTLFEKDIVDNYHDLNRENPDQYPITNWFDLIMRENAPRQNHSLNLVAGGENIRTKAAFGYDDIQGVYHGRSYDRITFRINNDFNISDKLSGIVDINGIHADIERPGSILTPNSIPPGIIYPAVWSDGRVAEGLAGNNPYGVITQGGTNEYVENSFKGRIGLDFKPIEGLKISGIFSPTISLNDNKFFSKKIPYTNYADPNFISGYIQGHSTTDLSETRSESYTYLTQFIGNYEKRIADHGFTLMAGYENYYTQDKGISARRNNYFLNSFPYLALGNSNFQFNSGSASELAYRSVFGRITYNYKYKYHLQINGRHDASSRFAKEYRGAFFPSVSAGWTLSEEPFMANASWLDFMKIRGSWGVLGNERIGDNYPYQSTIGFYTSGLYNGTTPVNAQAAAVNRYAIPNISWETTETYDVGVDVGLFDNKWSIVFDIYKKTTRDMLLELEIPSFIGLDNPNQNAGSMYTKGWEFQTEYRDNLGDFGYSVSFNITDSRSIMGDLKGTQFLGSKVRFEGSEYSEWYGYMSDGLFQTEEEVASSPTITDNVKPGDIKLLDISGPDGMPDGRISAEYDRVLLGGSLARYLYGGNIKLNYKSFDFSLFVQGVGKQTAQMDFDWVKPITRIPELTKGKYWSHYNTDEENLNAQYPRVSGFYRENNYSTLNDFWLFNGAYFRLKNVVLGYTIKESVLNALGMKNARIYATATDLFSLSKYPDDRDPEGTSNFITSSYNFGISINF